MFSFICAYRYLYVSRLPSTLIYACIRVYAPHTCGCVDVCVCLYSLEYL